ncbi:hypothetical protein GKC28_14170 [Leisingera sp. ANG59]|nr:hypothetical protein [Leisingera sp. ANG59]
MGASFHPKGYGDHSGRIYDILFDAAPLPQSLAVGRRRTGTEPTPTVLSLKPDRDAKLPKGLPLHLVQDRADIDISGPEFNFVRSIRVYDVRYARQHESGRDGDCSRTATVRLGTYGVQGDFAWTTSSLADLPDAHVGLERWGEHCPGIFHRSVFVDWRDYEGNYGYEQVNY